MNHLKYFRESTNTKLYRKINASEIYDIIQTKGDAIEISDMELKSITKKLDPILNREPGTRNGGPAFYGNIDINNPVHRRSGYNWFLKTVDGDDLLSQMLQHSGKDIFINKFKDDWYLAQLQIHNNYIPNEYYLCDTFEGVYEVIDDRLLSGKF